jgi:hypothetical protein
VVIRWSITTNLKHPLDESRLVHHVHLSSEFVEVALGAIFLYLEGRGTARGPLKQDISKRDFRQLSLPGNIDSIRKLTGNQLWQSVSGHGSYTQSSQPGKQQN